MIGIDVVIPNYNYGRFLEACVRSVLDQDVDGLRILIIDNASTDDSADIARRLKAEDDRIELVLRRENRGTHASFNEGIDWARSDYFLLLFADDFLMPGALARAIRVMEDDISIAFTYGRDVAIRNNEKIPEIPAQVERPPVRLHEGRDFIERFCRLGIFQIPGPSIVIRTDVQKRVGHYRPELPHTDDYEVWLRLAMLGRVGELDCIQAGIRSHGSNRSMDLWQHQLQHIRHTQAAAESFFNHEGRRFHDSKLMRARARRGIANRAYWSAVSHLMRGSSEAFSLLFLAFTLSPRTVLLPPISYLLHRPETVQRLLSMAMKWR